MDFKKDYYKILEVKENASKDEIKKAFRSLAKKYHPDVNPGDKEAEKRFKEINEANDVLSDEKKKAQYDAMRKGAFTSGPYGEYSDFDFSGGRDFAFDLEDVFGDIFSNTVQGEGVPSQGRDIAIKTKLSFEEAAKGTAREVRYRRPVECVHCDGMGIQKSARSTCSTCGGMGKFGKKTGFLNFAQICNSCRGSGYTGPICSHCAGGGVKETFERIKVNIPPGANTGTKVRVAGKGEAGRRGGPPGDLYLELNVAPHSFLRREGNDIFVEIPLNYSEAALGATIEVPTIDGMVNVKVPPGTDSGKKIRLKGKGVYRIKGGRGDQYVLVKVVVPERSDEEFRKLVKDLSKWEDNTIRNRVRKKD